MVSAKISEICSQWFLFGCFFVLSIDENKTLLSANINRLVCPTPMD